MKISFLSDLHINDPSGLEQKLFEAFCDSPYTQEASHVILLGDMFDFLVGEHQQYFTKYKNFFKKIIQLLDQKKKVIYLEGNHDFHIEETFKSYILEQSQYPQNFTYIKIGENIKLDNKTYRFCHGYEVDYNNESFRKWYNIYNSKPFKLLANKLFPYALINHIGDLASKNSKKRGKSTFNFDFAKKKYIAGAKSFIDELKVDGVICGHTHIQEMYIYPDKTIYLNCGLPKKDRNFLHYSEGEFKFISLAES